MQIRRRFKHVVRVKAYSSNFFIEQLRKKSTQKRLAAFTLLFMAFQILSPFGSLLHKEGAHALSANTYYARMVFPPQKGLFATGVGTDFEMPASYKFTMDGLLTDAQGDGTVATTLRYKAAFRNSAMPANTWCHFGSAIADGPGSGTTNGYPVVNASASGANTPSDPTAFCDYIVNDSSSVDPNHQKYSVGSTEGTINSSGWTGDVNNSGDAKFLANVQLPIGEYEWKVRVGHDTGSGNLALSDWSTTSGYFSVVATNTTGVDTADGANRITGQPTSSYDPASRTFTVTKPAGAAASDEFAYKLVFAKKASSTTVDEWCTLGGNPQSSSDSGLTNTGAAPGYLAGEITGIDDESVKTYPVFNNGPDYQGNNQFFNLGTNCKQYMTHEISDGSLQYSLTGWAPFTDYDTSTDNISYPYSTAAANEARYFSASTVTFTFPSQLVLPAGDYVFSVLGQYKTLNAAGFINGDDSVVTSDSAKRVYTNWSDAQTLTVTPVTGVTVAPTSTSIVAGSNVQLTATVSPAGADNKNVTWTTANAGIATVSSTGLVHGVSAGGPVNITVTTQEGGMTATSAITVSAAATLAINSATPADQTKNVGQTATFSVTATGGVGTLHYQWQLNGTNITGATSSSYTTPTLASTDDGNLYTVVVTDSDTTPNEATSREALLTMNAVAVDIDPATPANQTKNVGQTATFSVTATGGVGTLHYQWQLDGTNITGATSSSYTTPTLASTDNGNLYSVVVTDSDTTPNEATSRDALLTMNGSGSVAVTGVSISPASVTLTEASGSSHTSQLSATVTPTNATDKTVSWASSDASVATVSVTGLVTAVGSGTATITATSNDDDTISDTSSITVTAAANYDIMPSNKSLPLTLMGGDVEMDFTGTGDSKIGSGFDVSASSSAASTHDAPPGRSILIVYHLDTTQSTKTGYNVDVTLLYPSGSTYVSGDTVMYWTGSAWSSSGITGVTSNSPDTITFTTTHFSDFAIMNTTDASLIPTGDTNGDGVVDEADALPVSGGDVLNLFMNMLLAGVMLALMVAYSKRTKYAFLLN